jgi:hypothetical protein
VVCGPCQVDAEAPVTLVATNTLSGARVRHTRLLPARRPQAFVVEGLSPASHYALHFEGILDSEIRRGSFHTAPDYNANNAAASRGGGSTSSASGGGGTSETELSSSSWVLSTRGGPFMIDGRSPASANWMGA